MRAALRRSGPPTTAASNPPGCGRPRLHAEAADDGGPPASPPHRVRLPVNVHRWDRISFLHWPVEPHEIASRLPDELSVATWDGAAWVGLTPFVIQVRPPGLPVVPPRWAFPETNLRTYVRQADGREGLWFLRMEVSALWFVATLRTIGLPYFRQRMSVDVAPGRVVYESAARWPNAGGGHHIVVRPGDELEPSHGGPFERFLTARWATFHRRGPLLLYTPVEHPPWVLRAADVEVCDVGALFRAAGLQGPTQPPVAHFSDGVSVKVGRPRRVV